MVRAADLYLKEGGTVALVMPRSLCSADQHDGLRRGSFRFINDTMSRLNWTELWDCDKVEPLFNVPTCVLWGEKTTGAVPPAQTFPGEVLAGKLPQKNASLEEAQAHLTVETTEFSLSQHGRRSYWSPGTGGKTSGGSWYRDKFFQGATIVPRSFWFVRVQPSPWGFDQERPPLETDPRAIKEAKEPFRDVHLSGQVEKHFLYATLLSSDLLPFAHLNYRLVVLPVEPQGTNFRLLTAKSSKERGFSELAKWLEKAETIWNERRREKSNLMNIYERIDRVHGITRQNHKSKYRVIYNKSGTFLTATMLKENKIDFIIDDQKITTFSFLADYVTYYLETYNLDEAYFLTSFLNSPIIDSLVTPMQTRGAWGPRDITKKVFDLPIPRFKKQNHLHSHLAQLGEHCAKRVQDWLAQGGPGRIKSIGRLRGMVRVMLQAELAEIDDLVRQILP
jgi:hypothetical protein